MVLQKDAKTAKQTSSAQRWHDRTNCLHSVRRILCGCSEKEPQGEERRGEASRGEARRGELLQHQSSSCTNRACSAGKRTRPLPAALISVCPAKLETGCRLPGCLVAGCLKARPQPGLVTLTQFEAVAPEQSSGCAGQVQQQTAAGSRDRTRQQRPNHANNKCRRQQQQRAGAGAGVAGVEARQWQTEQFINI